MNETRKENWAYLAGLLDGEGCFTITGFWKKRLPAPKTPEGALHYFKMGLTIILYNTDVRVMKWLVQHFGGTYYVHHPSKQPNHKTGYSWHPKGAKNKELMILATLPYLIIKREQAQISLEYLRMDGARNIERRLELRDRLQSLNGHGRGKRQTTNMSDRPEDERKIESGLIGDYESELAVTQVEPEFEEEFAAT